MWLPAWRGNNLLPRLGALIFRTFPACFIFLALLSTAAGAEELAGYTIGKITIIRDNVFDEKNPKESGIIGTSGNKIHTVTQESVIRNELLFKEGDPYDKRIIEETTRILRKRSILTDVYIKADPVPLNKTVDVTVHTRDQWSLIIGGTFGGTDENATTGLDFGEKNLAGFGQSVNYSLRHNNSGYTHSIGYTDPNFMGTRYAIRLGYDVVPNENVYKGIVEQPFYAITTKKAHGVSYIRTDHQESAMKFNSYRMNLYYGWATPHGDDILRTSLILSLGEQRVLEVNKAPEMKVDNKMQASFEFLRNPYEYAEETYIEKFRQKEDIPLGPRYTFLAGQRMTTLGSTTSDIALSFGVTKWHRFFERDYLLSKLNLTRNDDQFNDHLADAVLQYYARWFYRHMFVLRVQGTYMESETNRVHLGGTSGLRGYKADEFTGRNQAVINLEDRIFTYTPMLAGIIEPGFVLFADAGNTWNNYSGDTLKRLNSSVGAGLRIALLKAPGISLIRVDYGVPTEFDRPPVITIGMEGFF